MKYVYFEVWSLGDTIISSFRTLSITAGSALNWGSLRTSWVDFGRPLNSLTASISSSSSSSASSPKDRSLKFLHIIKLYKMHL